MLPALPIGRSNVPSPDEWTTVLHNDWADDLHRVSCETRQAREWVKVACKRGRWRVTKPGHAEPMIVSSDERSTIVFALLSNDAWTFNLIDAQRDTVLHGIWAMGEIDPTISAYPTNTKLPAPEISSGDRTLCACQIAQGGRCDGLFGSSDPGCLAYGSDCAKMLACARADDSAPPLCAHVTPTTHRCE